MARKVPKHFFNQSAVVPYHFRDDDLEILLISSRKKKRWVIPKGVKEPGLSAQDSAAQEAREEAGVEGVVLPEPIGDYKYRKWGGVCSVEVYLMEVDKVLDEWPESHRDREWMSPKTASKRVDEKDLKRMISSVPNRVLRRR